MARSRGFRLYEVQIFNGQTQKPLDFSLEGDHFARHLEQVAEARLAGEKFGVPPSLNHFARDKEDIEAEAEVRSQVFELRAVRRRGNRVRMKYRAGSVGSYAVAVSRQAGEEDVDVSDRAVLNDQRAWFIFPSSGRTGVLIAESVGRASGEETLQRWLHAASKAERDPDRHYRLGLTRVADPGHMQQLIEEDAFQEIVLRRRDERNDRSTTTEPFTIRAPIKTAYARSKTGQVVRGWLARRDDPFSHREGASQLAAILDPSLADVRFDDGYVKASGEDDSGQQLRPDVAKDIFTYSLGTGEATDARVLREAHAVAERIQGMSELELPWD